MRLKEELETYACKWWPENLVAQEAEASIIPTLVRTQDGFISILTLANPLNIESVFEVMSASDFAANLFLKHLMVLTDYGSEPLQRVNRNFQDYFPSKMIEFAVSGVLNEYQFLALPVRGTLNNKKMRTDASGIIQAVSQNPLYKDLIVLLLFGGNSTDDRAAHILRKCNVGNLIGNPVELKEFIKQRYIYVSRITGGAQANELGNAAQIYAKNYLDSKLEENYIITSNGQIPGVTHNDGRTLTTFDLVVEKDGKYIGIEISFQVTTNSTIERKAGQAKARFSNVATSGNYLAYIIDGAGNFQRTSALTTICENSHCTVAYTDAEFDVLISFIQEKLG